MADGVASVGVSFRFKKNFPAAKRKAEAQKILQKYPDRIPIILEKDPKCSLKNHTHRKFLAPDSMTAKDLIFLLQYSLDARHDKLYLFAGNKLISPNETMINLYKNHKDDDEYVYFSYSDVSTFD